MVMSVWGLEVSNGDIESLYVNACTVEIFFFILIKSLK